jgi:predicted  nucleic acid-binding Zn-ribbon protein
MFQIEIDKLKNDLSKINQSIKACETRLNNNRIQASMIEIQLQKLEERIKKEKQDD